MEIAMRILLPFLALATLGGCAGDPSPSQQAASARRDVADSAELADALKDKIPGKPVSCINLRDIRSTKTIGDKTLIYDVSSKLVYRNDPVGGCPASAPGRTLISRTPSNQLCRGDILRVVDLTAGFEAGSCGLGDFTPYRSQ
jgi:hypothetical protein